MDQKSRIRKIMAKTNCSYDQALEADTKSNGNIDQAYDLANKMSNELYVGGGSSGLAVDSRPTQNVITSYKNGLLVNGKFYDYSVNSNIRLKKMLENNEFDADVLGVDDTRAEVVFKDQEKEMYKEESEKAEEKTKTYDASKKHVLKFGKPLNISCPDQIIMDEDGNIKFKILVDTQRIIVKMNNKMKIDDFYKEFKKYTDKNVVLVKGDKKIDPNDDISVLKQTLFKIVEEE
ncbi:hypothetical protein P3W45_000583 [Vairimorpha bombi]|jgi:hypothetical protein